MFMQGFRVGQGFDSHALVPGRKLILGGVEIPFDKGLMGHSDADALVHAIIDSLLGAAGEGDIGRCFPDTDPALAGADSIVLLMRVSSKIREAGWVLGNVDATVIAQAPKLGPYMDAMVARLAQALECDQSQVNIKAKTNEKLGHLGRGEGIAAHAIALLFKPNL
jgi:2-C-methyl-D-erythritol 2,4-cyclodiphosphate synthase